MKTVTASDYDFVVYSEGMVCTSVCTNMPLDMATERLNAERPTGISSKWHLSQDKAFSGGQENPCPCDRHPLTHKHYLFNC